MPDSQQASPGPIVVGYDGSPTSTTALRWAVDHAATLGAPLVVALADGVELDPSLTESVTAIEAVTGKVAAALLQVVRDRHAGLLVLGRRGRGGFASLLLGSVSDECATKAPCPVVVTGKHAGTQASDRLIVVGVDGSPDADHALSWAADVARATGARLHVISSWEAIEVPPDSLAGSLPFLSDQTQNYLQSDASELLKVTLQRCADQLHDLDVSSEACVGDPASVLVDVAADLHASLLVVGTRGVGGIRPLVLGSVAKSCLHHAPCPVAVTRVAAAAVA